MERAASVSTGDCGSHGLLRCGRCDTGADLHVTAAWTILRGLAVAAVLVVPAVSIGQGAGSCPGDCNDDRVVQVDELLVGVGIALGARPLGACQSFDANGDTVVTVDELVQGVDAALDGCMPASTSAQLTNAASGVAVSTTGTVNQVITIVNFGSIGFGGGGRTAASPLGRRALGFARQPGLIPRSGSSRLDDGAAAGQTFFLCPVDGSFETSCTSDGFGTFTLDTFYSNCEFFDEFGNDVFIDGEALQSSSDPLICGDVSLGSIDAEYSLLNFAVFVTDVTGTTTALFAEDLLDLVGPLDAGCAGPGSVQVIDGDLAVTIFTPDAATVYDVEYVADNLGLGVGSFGEPCSTLVLTDGSLDVFNGLTFEEFSQEFVEYAITTTVETDGHVERILEGRINTRCVGDVEIATPEVLQFQSVDDLCPIAGTLQIALADGTVNHVQYSAMGVDFDGDGIADVSSCFDTSIAQCPGECDPCNQDADCTGVLECFVCTDNCVPDAPARCAPVDFSATCSDGSF